MIELNGESEKLVRQVYQAGDFTDVDAAVVTMAKEYLRRSAAHKLSSMAGEIEWEEGYPEKARQLEKERAEQVLKEYLGQVDNE